VAALILAPCLALAVEGQLLGLSATTGNPNINSATKTGLSCGYNAGILSLQSEASNIQFVDNGAFTDIFDSTGTVLGGLLSISAPVDSSGNLGAGGTLTVTGFYLDSLGVVQGPTLLTADITDFGILDSGSTDAAEFAITVTGGAAPADVNWVASNSGNVLLSLVNSGYAGSATTTGFGTDWTCDASAAIVALAQEMGVIPFDCFAVNRVLIRNKNGTNKDVIRVTKAGFRLDPPNTVDMAVDTTVITVGAKTFTFPPGSFVCNGPNNGNCKFKSATGAVPKITANLNFTKATWGLRVKGEDTSGFTVGAIDVTLQIDGFESTESVTLKVQGMGSKGSKGSGKGDTLIFTAKPKKSCRRPGSDSSDNGDPGSGKLSCISSMTVRYDNGVDPIEYITKTRAAGELLHPNTVFSDTLNNDLGIFHTSCSKCLTCGDVDGNFTITGIDVLPGDKLSQKCGVPDASCTTLLP